MGRRDPPPAWLRGLTAAALSLAGVLGMLLVVAGVDSHYPVAGDAHYLFASARSLAFDGDLDLTNQFRVMGDRWGLLRDPATDGWRLPPREVGPALLMIPGLLVHHGLGLHARWEPAFACLLAAASLGPCWLACTALLDTLADERSSRSGWLAFAAVLGFVVPFYVVGRSGYAHALDATVCAALLWALVARRGRLVIGALLTCAVLVRMQNLLWLAWPIVDVIVAGRDDRRRALADLGVIAGLGLLGLAPQIYLGLAHPGSEHGAIRWSLAFFDLRDYPRDLGRVIAGAHGLVSWTPLAGLALAGLLVDSYRPSGRRPAARRAGLVFGLMILLMASVRDVDGGDAFGARRLAGMTGCLALGLFALWTRASASAHPRAAAWILASALSLATAANLVRVERALTGRLELKEP